MSTSFQDLQAQLAQLRRGMAHAAARADRRHGAVGRAPAAMRVSAEAEALSGIEAGTSMGKHWEIEKAYPEHGSIQTHTLMQMPEDLLGAISNEAIANVAPGRIAFLDTETTGLAGGTGTVAFVTGVGRITREGFIIRQFFLRDFDEEPSALLALAEHLEEFDVLVTYNGKSFDQPLLETRYRMTRQRPPFGRMEHLDLLYGARRLWKLQFESCRLVDLEQRVLGVERVGDVPGDMIPRLYFDYLRTKRGSRLEPVLEHNRLDIVSLACLTSIVPRAFHSPHEVALSGGEMIGLGRWMIANERFADGLVLMRRALECHIPDELVFRTLWDIAITEKKLGRGPDAFHELVQSRNPYRVPALEELAKHYEHQEKDPARALDLTVTAMALGETEELRRRAERLQRKLDRPRSRRLIG